MARISEFEQRNADSIEIAISEAEYENLGTGSGQLKLRVGTFKADGTEYQSLDVSTDQADWTLDRNSGEYVYTLNDAIGNHSINYQGLVLGSVDSNGEAIEIYDAYMIGNFNAASFDFSRTADTVTTSGSWVPEGTKFTDISQENATPSAGGDGLPTLRWDWPDHIDNPVAQFDSDLDDTAPCFVRGALVETPNGAVRIESLKVGDFVRTRDNGFQPLRWIGYGRIYRHVMTSDPRRYPIRLRAGALDTNIPMRECYFSRQHRVLVTTMDNPDGVLIPVKDLIGQPGIELASDWQGHIDYFHMLFDRHEIVFSDGVQSESLLLTEYSFSLLGAAAKSEILTVVPNNDEMKPARKIFKGKLARNHLAKITETGLQLQDQSISA